jgi:hypothetical protein
MKKKNEESQAVVKVEAVATPPVEAVTVATPPVEAVTVATPPVATPPVVMPMVSYMTEIAVKSIRPNEQNPRGLPYEGLEGLKASIQAEGIKTPITVNKSFVVLKGHRRLECLKALGIEKTTVLVIEATAEEELKILLDHSERPLNKRELARAFRTAFKLNNSEKKAYSITGDLISAVYGTPKDCPDVFKHHRGTCQLLAKLSRLPEYVTDDFYSKILTCAQVTELDKYVGNLPLKMTGEERDKSILDKCEEIAKAPKKTKTGSGNKKMRTKEEITAKILALPEGQAKNALLWVLGETEEC